MERYYGKNGWWEEEGSLTQKQMRLTLSLDITSQAMMLRASQLARRGKTGEVDGRGGEQRSSEFQLTS